MPKNAGFSLIELMVSLGLIAIVAAGVLRVTNGALIENRKYHVQTIMHELALDRLEEVTAAFPVISKMAGTEDDLNPVEMGSTVKFTRVTTIDLANSLATVSVSSKDGFFINHSVSVSRRLIQW